MFLMDSKPVVIREGPVFRDIRQVLEETASRRTNKLYDAPIIVFAFWAIQPRPQYIASIEVDDSDLLPGTIG